MRCPHSQQQRTQQPQMVRCPHAQQRPPPQRVGCPNTTGDAKPPPRSNPCRTIVPCSFKDMGCEFRGAKCKLAKHIEKHSRQHLTLVNEAMNKHYDEISNLNEDIDCLSDKNRDQEEELENMRNELQENAEVVKDLSEKNRELEDQVTRLKEEAEIESKRSAEQKEEMERLEEELQKLKNSTGSFFWKITDFKYKQKMAKEGTETTQWSPPFYNEVNGYKLRALLYPNGYDTEEGVGMSLLVQIMKGEYDDTLSWPFNKTIMMTLVNQNPNARPNSDIQEVVRPIPWMEAFQKPKEEDNSFYGSPAFVTHKMMFLKDLVYNDTLLFRFKVM